MGMDRRRRFQIFAALVSCAIFEIHCYSDLDDEDGVYITKHGRKAIGYDEHQMSCVAPNDVYNNLLGLYISSKFDLPLFMLPARRNKSHFVGVIKYKPWYYKRENLDPVCWTVSGDFIDLKTCGGFPNQSWSIAEANQVFEIWGKPIAVNVWYIWDEMGRIVTFQYDDRLVLVKQDTDFQTKQRPHKFLFEFHAANSQRFFGGGKSEFYIYALVLTICHLTFILYTLTSFRPCMSFTSSLRSWTTSHCKALWQRCTIPLDDACSKKVRELARHRRITHAHSGLGAIMNFGLSPLLFVQILMAWSRHLRYDDYHWPLYCHELLPLAILSPVVLLFCRRERYRSSRTLDFFRVLASAVWICKLKISANHCFRFNDDLISQCRLVFSIIVGNAKLASLLEPIVTLANVLIYAQVTFENGDNVGNAVEYYVLKSVAHLVLSLTLVWVVELTMLREAQASVEAMHSRECEIRAAVEAEENKQTAKLAEKLLACMCDAVVQLDGNLRTSRPSPKLAAMLQTQVGNSQPLLGARLQDFMDPESSTRYAEYMMEQIQHAEDNRVPRPLHIDLYDSQKIKVPTVIVGVCIQDGYGEGVVHKFVIGITEVLERFAEPISDGSDVPRLDQFPACSSASGRSEDAPPSLAVDDMEVTFSMQEHTQIKSATVSFCNLIRIAEPSSDQLHQLPLLKDFILSATQFEQDIFACLDDARYKEQGDMYPVEFSMSVRWPHITTHGQKLRRCTLHVVAQVDIPYPDDARPIRMKFASINKQQKGRLQGTHPRPPASSIEQLASNPIDSSLRSVSTARPPSQARDRLTSIDRSLAHAYGRRIEL